MTQAPAKRACGPDRACVRSAASGGGLAVGQLPARAREVAGVAVRVALEVVLVLRLGLPEGDGLAHLGHHLAGPQSRRVDVGDRLLRDLALLVARVEDLGAVARADVVALAVLGRRVVDLEEELQDVPIGDALGVEDNLDRLGVPGMVPVGRVLVLSTGVSDPGGDDSIALTQQLLDAPEAPSREDGGLGVVAHNALLPSKLGVRDPFNPTRTARGSAGARRSRAGATAATDKPYVMIGMIRIATMFATLIIGLIAGPAVSLNGSPTVSPVTDAAWASEPLPPNAPSSISFFALSHAPPPAVIRTAKKNPTTITPISRPPRARSSIRPTIVVMPIGSSDGRIISRCAARVTSAAAVSYSGCSVPSMIPGFSRNWRRTSSTTAPPARPAASIDKAANRQTIRPPSSRPMRTAGSLMAKSTGWPSSLVSSAWKPANSTTAATTAEPMA